jgi:dipeptidyl aminopeptidase/acylaminoacyl peptidase
VLKLDPHNLEAQFMQAETEQPSVQPVNQPIFPIAQPTERDTKPQAPLAAQPKKPIDKTTWIILGLTGSLMVCLLCIGSIFTSYQLGLWGKKTPTPQAFTAPAVGGSNLFVEYVLDASGSMNEMLPDGVRKIDAAKERLTNSLKTYRPEASVGLRVYGHRIEYDDQEKSCRDIELIAPVAPGYLGNIITWLQNYQAFGMTPITSALQQAVADFSPDPQRTNSIVLISDGMETCGGDPCEFVKQLGAQGLRFKMHVIGINVDDPTREQLRCIADAGSGIYQDANTSQELQFALDLVQAQIVRDAETIPTEPAALFDGQIAYIGTDLNVYVLRGTQTTPIQITFEGSQNYTYEFLRWSPDGRKLAYLGGEVDPESYDDPLMTLFIVEPGNGQSQALLSDVYGFDWHPGSNKIYYGSQSGSIDTTKPWIGILDLNTGNNSVFSPAFEYDRDVRFPEFSPDGKWSLISSRLPPSESWFGRSLINIENSNVTPISFADGFYDWAPDSSQIAYTMGGFAPGDSTSTITIADINSQKSREIFSCIPRSEMDNIVEYLDQIGCIRSLLWSPQGNELLFGTPDGTMRITPDGSSLNLLTNSGIPTTWSPNGKQLLLRNESNYLIYDSATNDILFEFASSPNKGYWYKDYVDWGKLPSGFVNSPQNEQSVAQTTPTLPKLTPTQPVPVSRLTMDQIYSMAWSLPIYGENSLYQGPFSNGEIIRDDLFFSSRITDVAFGDLIEDAAILITERFGNTSYYHSLVVITNHNGNPAFGNSLTLESLSGTTEKLEIQDGNIMVTGMWWAPGDANCCPSLQKGVSYRLTSNGLENVSQ